MYPGHVYKQILLCEEDIENLKNAYNTIWKYMTLEDKQYEALELFTLKNIIDTWEKSSEFKVITTNTTDEGQDIFLKPWE